MTLGEYDIGCPSIEWGAQAGPEQLDPTYAEALRRWSRVHSVGARIYAAAEAHFAQGERVN